MIGFAAARQNRLLAALPEATLTRWLPHLELELMQLGAAVHSTPLSKQYVHFPVTALVSLLHVMADGASAEIAVIGNDGVVGMSILMDSGAVAASGVVQSAGSAYRLPTNFLVHEFNHTPGVMHLLLRYTQSLMSQMVQTAACNRHHHIEQQLCRWLLLSLDRTGHVDLVMTQELIANMLGVRRQGVARAAASLQRRGVIRYARGHLTVLNRAALEAESCECYSNDRNHLDQLFSVLLPS